MRSIATTVPMIRGAEAGILLTRDGNTLPLSGLPTHPMLALGSDVLTAVADQLTGAQVYATFLCPRPERDIESHARITVLAFPPQPPRSPSSARCCSARP
jgi:hypothetical protein